MVGEIKIVCCRHASCMRRATVYTLLVSITRLQSDLRLYGGCWLAAVHFFINLACCDCRFYERVFYIGRICPLQHFTVVIQVPTNRSYPSGVLQISLSGYRINLLECKLLEDFCLLTVILSKRFDPSRGLKKIFNLSILNLVYLF